MTIKEFKSIIEYGKENSMQVAESYDFLKRHGELVYNHLTRMFKKSKAFEEYKNNKYDYIVLDWFVAYAETV